MEITPQLFDHIAHLARLHFDDAEKENIRKDMQKMVSFVEKLRELDTDGVEPLLHMSDLTQIPRADIASNGNTIASVLQNAPQTDGQYFLVPKVIENPDSQ